MRFIYTKAFAIFAVCLVIAAIFSIMQLKGWLDPIRSAMMKVPRPVIVVVNDISRPVKNFFLTIYQLRQIASENAQLRSQALTLQQQLVGYDQETRENQALRAELGFVKNSQLSLLSCNVLSENPLGLTDSLVLDCGTAKGADVGQAVISQGYLVGKITYAGPDLSTVQLITAADFSTDALVSKTAATGIVKGSYGSGMIVDQIQQTSPLAKGDLIVTAGISAQIPKEIIIGQVGDILSKDSDLFKRASLISPIDFNNLQFVFVVKS